LYKLTTTRKRDIEKKKRGKRNVRSKKRLKKLDRPECGELSAPEGSFSPEREKPEGGEPQLYTVGLKRRRRGGADQMAEDRKKRRKRPVPIGGRGDQSGKEGSSETGGTERGLGGKRKGEKWGK